MSTATRPKHRPPISEDILFEFTTDAFFRMVDSGEFPEEARVYLEDGRIYEKMTKTNAHTGLGAYIPMVLSQRLPPGWAAFPEGQFRLDEKNSPLPDVTVIRCDDPRDFAEQGRRPESRDVGVVIEIAVTSLAKDLGPNLERYARNGIPNYWVADVMGQRLLIHTRPRVVNGRGEYEETQVVEPGGSFTLVLDGRETARFSYEDLMFRTVPPPVPGD